MYDVLCCAVLYRRLVWKADQSKPERTHDQLYFLGIRKVRLQVLPRYGVDHTVSEDLLACAGGNSVKIYRYLEFVHVRWDGI